MLTTFKATARKTETGLQVEAASRGFQLIVDEPAELGGTDTGMNPVEATLCALGSCQSIVCAAFAASQGFNYESFWIELEGDLDPDGFMGLAECRNGFQEIRFTHHFVTDEPQEKVDAFSRFIEAHCPVGDNLMNGVPLKLMASVIETEEKSVQASLTNGGGPSASGRIEVQAPSMPGAKELIIGKIFVKEGDQVAKGQELLTVEAAKGSSTVKAQEAGVVESIVVKEGDKIVPKAMCLTMLIGNTKDEMKEQFFQLEKVEKTTDVMIIGGGTGGYVSAIRAARAGKKVLLVEKNRLGGTCLNVGCIPTKTLIASAHRYHESVNADIFGIDITGNIRPDMEKIIERKDGVVDRLVGGIEYLMEKNGVEVLYGQASFVKNGTVKVTGDKEYTITFADCIIATGSSVMTPPIPGIEGSRIMDSTAALSETELPDAITIVGGGVIGLEFAFLYRDLGVDVTVIEFLDRLVSVMDKDISEEIASIAREKGIHIELSSKVTSFTETINDKVVTTFEKDGKTYAVTSDKVLVAIGRKSNTEGLGLENTDIEMNPGGRGIAVDDFMRTNVEHIYAVGDVNNRIQLAHAASYEGMIAVDHILNKETSFDKSIIPSVIFTKPEMASVGLNKAQAQQAGIAYKEGTFHYNANGKALTMDETEGYIRLLMDEEKTIIGGAIIGADASTLVASLGLCVANHMTVEDLERTVFAHPTTAEVIHEAALDLTGGAYHE